MILFRDRNTFAEIDSSFFLKSYDPKFVDMQYIHLGDKMSFIFDMNKEQLEALARSGLPVDYINEKFVGIPCVVVERSHSATFKEVGRLEYGSSSIKFEAVSDQWQDVLKWVLFGAKPAWA